MKWNPPGIQAPSAEGEVPFELRGAPHSHASTTHLGLFVLACLLLGGSLLRTLMQDAANKAAASQHALQYFILSLAGLMLCGFWFRTVRARSRSTAEASLVRTGIPTTEPAKTAPLSVSRAA